jgi:hypothetical protein
VAARVKFNYEEGEDGNPRPYLWLDLKLESGPSIRVRGLFDSGADVSLLALDYREALGLAPQDLDAHTAEGPAGKIDVQRSRRPVQARLPGEPEIDALDRMAWQCAAATLEAATEVYRYFLT